jgi:colanic acid/amylovoran biosynthesis glycosyltransferase
MIRAPGRFFAALVLALRAMRSSDRPFVWHLFYLAEACWIVPLLAGQNISHVHAHFGSNPAEVAMYVAAMSGVSYSVTIHGPEEFDRAQGLNLGEKIRRASFVVAISSYCRSQLYRMVERCHWHKIKLVYCGVDAGFSALDAVVPSPSNQLVCVGRLCPEKGHLLLLQAAGALAREGRDFSLVLVGDGEDRVEIEKLIAAYGIAEQVKLIGWASAERVKQEIFAARALVLPSFAEGLPIVLIEAMILGRPVLTTTIAGIPELVVNRETGWLFPAGSEEALLAALRACLDAPRETLQLMGNLARARALEQHDVDNQADILSGLFESVLQDAR